MTHSPFAYHSWGNICSITNTFSERLQAVRSELSVSRREMAEKISVPYGTYRRYEDGETAPPREVLIRVSDLNNYDLNWLLSGRGEMHFQDTSVESDPEFDEFAANEAGDPGLQVLLSDENRKKYGITDDEAKTLKSVLFRRKGKGTLEQWLRVLWSIRELE